MLVGNTTDGGYGLGWDGREDSDEFPRDARLEAQTALEANQDRGQQANARERMFGNKLLNPFTGGRWRWVQGAGQLVSEVQECEAYGLAAVLLASSAYQTACCGCQSAGRCRWVGGNDCPRVLAEGLRLHGSASGGQPQRTKEQQDTETDSLEEAQPGGSSWWVIVGGWQGLRGGWFTSCPPGSA